MGFLRMTAMGAAAALALCAVIMLACSPAVDAATGLSLTSASDGESEYGDSVSFTATRSGDALADSLEVSVDGDAVMRSAFSGRSKVDFTIDWSYLPVGAHTISVVYGDSGGSQSAAAVHTVSKRAITIYAEDLTMYFGDPAPQLTYRLSKQPAPVHGVDVTLKCDDYSVGDHKIDFDAKPSILPKSAEGSYDLKFAQGTLRVLASSDINMVVKKLEEIPFMKGTGNPKIDTQGDADKVAEAYRVYSSLTDDKKEQVPTDLKARLDGAIKLIEENDYLNRRSGTYSVTGVPWYVRLDVKAATDDERERLLGEMYRMDVLDAFKITLTNTVAGNATEYHPDAADDVTVFMLAGELSKGGANLVREVDGVVEDVDFHHVTGGVRMDLDSIGLYAVTAPADVRSLDTIGSATVMLILVAGGMLASMTLDRRLKAVPEEKQEAPKKAASPPPRPPEGGQGV